MIDKLFIQPTLMDSLYSSPAELVMDHVMTHYGKEYSERYLKSYLLKLIEYPADEFLVTDISIKHRSQEILLPSIAKLVKESMLMILDEANRASRVANLYLRIWHNMALQPYSIVLIDHSGIPLAIEQAVGYIEARHRLEDLIQDDSSMCKSRNRRLNAQWPCDKGIWHLVETSESPAPNLPYHVWAGDECIQGAATLDMARTIAASTPGKLQRDDEGREVYILTSRGVPPY